MINSLSKDSFEDNNVEHLNLIIDQEIEHRNVEFLSVQNNRFTSADAFVSMLRDEAQKSWWQRWYTNLLRISYFVYSAIVNQYHAMRIRVNKIRGIKEEEAVEQSMDKVPLVPRRGSGTMFDVASQLSSAKRKLNLKEDLDGLTAGSEPSTYRSHSEGVSSTTENTPRTPGGGINPHHRKTISATTDSSALSEAYLAADKSRRKRSGSLEGSESTQPSNPKDRKSLKRVVRSAVIVPNQLARKGSKDTIKVKEV
jgi:hypothetical protein